VCAAGHFALVEPLLPKLRAQSHPSRVVVVSSMGHLFQRTALDMDDLHYEKRKYGRVAAYGQSKFANIMFASEIAER
jgi:NAD(P)-dependent dehydrogenase (short-subunit alcohol dehydrogenase family)